MICIYRYSDKGKDPKAFGYNISKKDCWESFLKSFPKSKKIIIADNCEEHSLFDGFEILKTNHGNSGSAKFAINFAVETFLEEDIYFSEDDYFYKGNCENLLSEALNYVDYATLYDHGDKYKNFNGSPNPLLKWHGEFTNLFRTASSHWKLTNSTTMTFAVNSKTLREDKEILFKYLDQNIPRDFEMFLDILKKRTLASSIPGRSTHLSPHFDNNSPFFNRYHENF